MLAAGRSNQAIAADLVVALDNRQKHVSHLLDKFGATNRAEAVARARQQGPDPPARGSRQERPVAGGASPGRSALPGAARQCSGRAIGAAPEARRPGR